MRDLTPKKIVEALDRYIIGQDAAKRVPRDMEGDRGLDQLSRFIASILNIP